MGHRKRRALRIHMGVDKTPLRTGEGGQSWAAVAVVVVVAVCQERGKLKHTQ